LDNCVSYRILAATKINIMVTAEIALHPNQYDANRDVWEMTFKGKDILMSEPNVRWFADSVEEALSSFSAEEVVQVIIKTDIEK
jgi:hypothetical protein